MRVLTVQSATPADVWPGGSGYSASVEIEIFRVARDEITAADMEQSGLTFSSWYIPYYLAEERVRSRRKAQADQPPAKPAPRAAPALPSPATAKHPSVAAWAKHPKYSPIKQGAAAKNPELAAFRKEWHQDHATVPLPVFRRDQPGHHLLTVSDGRKLYRDLLLHSDETTCSIFFLICRANNVIAKLTARIEELEDRKTPVYRGVWQEGKEYSEADIVTRAGSMFYCKTPTTEKPLQSDAWQLCVKSGRDGKIRYSKEGTDP